MIDLRLALGLVTGLGTGVFAALAITHASMNGPEAVALGAGAAAAAGLGLVGALWLEATRERVSSGALVVFLLFTGLGIMLGAGGHGAH